MAKALGVDVSKYDANVEHTKCWNPDNSQNKIDFVIQRLSYGGRADEALDYVYEQVYKVGVRGAYHYYSTGITAIDQANVFIKLAKAKDFHFYRIDYETAYNNLNASSLKDFRFVVDYAQQALGKKVGMYISPNIWNVYMKPFGATAWINNYDIWIAQYPYTQNLDLNKGPAMPKEILKWDLWQYGGGDVANTAGKTAGPAWGSVRAGIDLDQYNGTVEDMKVKFGIITPPVVQLTIDERVTRLEEIHNIK